MSEVTDSTPEVKLEGIPNGKYTIHIFHDSNGNYVLDRDANDIPIEYCATREIEITDEYKTFQIQLFNIKDKIDNK